ncbi:MAG: hypothetical protein GYB36_09615 [Alphaproteobacteria bacterium]|nr:hypothetical protein [Alphaproteobacteria bacterium]
MAHSSKARSLAYIRESASTARVLNLHRVFEKFGDTEEWASAPLFRSERLNTAFIIKHTLRADERENLRIERFTGTKVIFPLAKQDLRLGGFSLFVEQAGFAEGIQEALGKDADPDVIAADVEVLEEIAALPSLDPYLLRERIGRLGTRPARCYFDIADADVERVETYVVREIRKLVELAYGIEGPEARLISGKLAKLIMRDEKAKALDPLRQTLRLSGEEYAQGMFGWKGFLYYKWNLEALRPTFEPVAKEILSARFIRAHPDDETFLNQTRRSIVRALYQRIDEVDKALKAYDTAFNSLVHDGEPGAFRDFLLEAPKMFIETGEYLASINHICSFWRFRFPPGTPSRIEVDDAYDVFRDFSTSLGQDDRRLAA